jgi:hypothetical protein
MTSRAVAGAAAPSHVPAPIQASPAVVAQASFNISSHPPSADIEIDGSFVGSTPSTLQLSLGDHEITIKKKGFQTWTRKMKATSGSVNVNADLDPIH